MIDEDWRYFTYAGAITPGGPSRWDILDWDQRRTISVNISMEEHDGDVAIGITPLTWLACLEWDAIRL